MKSFLWAVAHSSFQVEGSPQDSDWRRWTRTKGFVADGSNAEVGTDFWNQYERDLNWVKELGANAFRFSLAWERLQPGAGEFDDEAFARYEKILDECAAREIEPLVTLLHFALPAWLVDCGGLTSPDFATHFENYARKVQERLGHRIKYLVTFNEPMVQISFGYLNGIWPPCLKGNGGLASIAAKNIALAHARVYEALKLLQPDLKISIAMHWRLFEARSKWNPIDNYLAKLADEFFNKAFLRAMLTRKSKFAALGAKAQAFDYIGDGPLIDFLGINYYGRMFVGFTFKPPFVAIAENSKAKNKSDLGWEIYPEGLRRILKECKTMSPDLPILITENGVADCADRVRSKFLNDHVRELLATASEIRVQVLGYTYWSLTDNFEWAEGLEPRFGLIKVNYPESGKAKDLTFEKRPAFYTYQKMIKKHLG